MQEWRVYSKKAEFSEIGSKYGIDPVVARIIRNRDIVDDKDINMYLNGTIKDLHNPALMKDMTKAKDILLDAIASGLKIRIIGDYDIDGICSIYILYRGLLSLGADVDYDVPDRIEDGYGINESLIKKAYDAGIQLIITCDNGIAAASQIKYAKNLGITVIVTDHHDIPFIEDEDGRHYILPEAEAVVDPKRLDCEYPWKALCGAGVAYKLISLMTNDIALLTELLGFAAIATIGDIVDLKDENRIIVKEGLKIVSETKNPGLKALMELTGVDRTKLSAYHIGFVIGPCLNASGRLNTAKRALEMLLTNDIGLAQRLAGDLKALNDERKKLTEEAVNTALEVIENSSLKENSVLVVYIPDCHESIAGIVAGKIKEHYYRPTIVLTKGKEGVKGSARSIEGYNMFEKLTECRELLTKFGGHPMAAGLSLKEENIEYLRKKLNEKAGLTEKELTEKIWIDVPMPIEYVTETVIEDIELLAPFGKGNEKPVFADKNLIISNVKSMGRNGKMAKMLLTKNNGKSIEAICFKDYDIFNEACINNTRLTCTYYPDINDFAGRRKLQIVITGYKLED